MQRIGKEICQTRRLDLLVIFISNWSKGKWLCVVMDFRLEQQASINSFCKQNICKQMWQLRKSDDLVWYSLSYNSSLVKTLDYPAVTISDIKPLGRTQCIVNVKRKTFFPYPVSIEIFCSMYIMCMLFHSKYTNLVSWSFHNMQVNIHKVVFLNTPSSSYILNPEIWSLKASF